MKLGVHWLALASSLHHAGLRAPPAAGQVRRCYRGGARHRCVLVSGAMAVLHAGCARGVGVIEEAADSTSQEHDARSPSERRDGSREADAADAAGVDGRAVGDGARDSRAPHADAMARDVPTISLPLPDAKPHDAPELAHDAVYVSPDGSDDNPGTLSSPFKTLEKARDAVRRLNRTMAGDQHVYLRGGVYELDEPIRFGPEDSGFNGHRVRYEGYPGETPILSGSTKVTGWVRHSGSIYKAHLERSTKLRNLVVNDVRAQMASKRVTARGGYGTYAVTAGQASWAWVSGSKSDGVKYDARELGPIAANKDDLEIINGTTWNENIVCSRDVVTTPEGSLAILLQQPYGAIAQTPGWGAGFSVTGSHTVYNALEFLAAPGQFYFDKATGTLYYDARPGEDMATADVQAPRAERLVEIQGTTKTNHVQNLTFQGITFQNTDYNLVSVAGSRGKATAQAATAFIAFGGDWHATKYEIIDTLPGMLTANGADGIELIGNVFKHAGADGIEMNNDVREAHIEGNLLSDVAGSAITIGHPQHIHIGDGGAHAKYAPDVEGVCRDNVVRNNVLLDASSMPGFGGLAGITAFFVESLSITHNHVQGTAYNGITLGWGWRNFVDSKTCKGNTVSQNRLVNTLNRLHDSGAIYTIGQMPGTQINENYVRGIPPATSGPTYGLHNDEGSAYITENDNVLDIDPAVKYTINCEDFGAKHDLTIRRTYATVNKMGVNPPSSTIDPPVAVPDNVWPLDRYAIVVASGVEEPYRSLLPRSIAVQDQVFPASCSATAAAEIPIRPAGAPSTSVWFAPMGTTQFTEGPSMVKAAGDATHLVAPSKAGTYRLFVVDADGRPVGQSAASLRVR